MEQASASSVLVGVDVAKDRLDVHLRPLGAGLAVARDGAGLDRLVAELRQLAPALIGLEATGGFERTVAAALAGAGLPLAVVNPRQIRDGACPPAAAWADRGARATGRLAGPALRQRNALTGGTDRLDAEIIALFAERIRPVPRPVAEAEAAALAELVARRRQIVEMIGMESNRRRQVQGRRVAASLDATLEVLKARLAAIDRDIDGAVEACPARRATEELLTSVPGVGDATARTLIAGRSTLSIDPELGRSDRRGRRASRRPQRARHGHARRRPLEPRPQGPLRPARRPRPTAQGRPPRLHPTPPRHPQRDPARPSGLERARSCPGVDLIQDQRPRAAGRSRPKAAPAGARQRPP
jgi:transposase